MEIIFIGTGCGIPSLRRGAASLLLSSDNENIWIDTGPGSLKKLLEAGYTYKDIDYILYTHFHIDHIADLAPMVFASKYQNDLRQKDLPIIGPPGMKEFYRKLEHLYGNQMRDLNYTITVIELTKSYTTQNFQIESLASVHTAESISLKIKDNDKNTLVYSGDTAYFPALAQFAQHADLLILECSFPEPVPGHLNPPDVGKIAQAAGIKHLVITHLYPICDMKDIITPIEKRFNGTITIAEDLIKLKVR